MRKFAKYATVIISGAVLALIQPGRNSFFLSTGSQAMHFCRGAERDFTVSQSIKAKEAGKYTAYMYLQGGGGQENEEIQFTLANDNDKTSNQVQAHFQGWENWRQPKAEEIKTDAVTTQSSGSSDSIEDENTGVVVEVDTITEENKTIVIERVNYSDGKETFKETVTEEMDDITVVTEKLESTEVNATMVITTTYDTYDNVIDANAIIYTGIPDMNNDYPARITIPEDYLLELEEANIKSAGLCIEKPVVDAVKDNSGRKIVIKVKLPEVSVISVNSVTVTKESIASVVGGNRKLVVKVVNENPSKSFTITIPQSEVKKAAEGIKVNVNTRKISGMDNGKRDKVKGILSSNGVKTENSYSVSIAGNKAKDGIGIKITAPVLLSGVNTGSSVYVYCYNTGTGRLEEIANSKRNVLRGNMAGFEGYTGKDYVITNKELSGKDVVTLLDKSNISFNKTTVEKGGSIKTIVNLPVELTAKSSLHASVPYGKQAALVTYQTSSCKVVKVSEDGTIKAAGKGKAVIIVKIKLAGGKVRTIKKSITVK